MVSRVRGIGVLGVVNAVASFVSPLIIVLTCAVEDERRADVSGLDVQSLTTQGETVYFVPDLWRETEEGRGLLIGVRNRSHGGRCLLDMSLARFRSSSHGMEPVGERGLLVRVRNCSHGE